MSKKYGRGIRARLALAAVLPFTAGAVLAAGLLTPVPAPAGPSVTPAVTGAQAVPVTLDAWHESPGNRALDWAEAHAAGCWYRWGGTSCSPGYDCSGLVSTAILRATGIWTGRTTYEIARSPRLHWIPLSQARRGDILFYGTGHVELDTAWWHTSFGAHSSGQRVGWITWGWGWVPSAAYRLW